MAREIERKFLVNGNAWRKGAQRARLRQGYLYAGQDKSIRVRLENGRGTLTIKGPIRGSVCAEYEYAIAARDARELLGRLCERPLIEKTRHRVKYGGLVWEIDEFSGANRGLIVAEIELDRVRRAIALPPWIGKEVTHDPRYRNANLYKRPYGRWAVPSLRK